MVDQTTKSHDLKNNIFDNINSIYNESSKVHCIFINQREIGQGLLNQQIRFLSDMLLDLIFQSK